MLGLLPPDFPAWNLAALTGTDADDAEELLEQLVDAVLVDVAGVDATGLIRYRLHDLLRAFARECLAEAEPPSVRKESLARLADQYIGAARLASALVHPGAPDSGAAPAGQLLAEDVVRGDPWGWFMAERASLIRLVKQAHAAGLWARTWQLTELLPVMFDWRSWERTHQLALDAVRQAGDADAEAGIMRSLAEAIETFSAGLAVFRSAADNRSEAGALNGMADAHRGLSCWAEGAWRWCCVTAVTPGAWPGIWTRRQGTWRTRSGGSRPLATGAGSLASECGWRGSASA